MNMQNGVPATTVSRRDFLALVAATQGAWIVGSGAPLAAERDPKVTALLATTVTVDLHNHGGLQRPPAAAPAARPAPVGAGARPGVTLGRDANARAAMSRAGDSVVCLAYALDGPLMGGGDPAPGTRSNLQRDPQPGEFYQAHLKYMDDYDALFKATPELVRVRTWADIEQARTDGRSAIIQDAEGADFLEKGHLDRLAGAHARGLRKLQLVHYAVNDIADFQIGPVEHRGLSAFGVDVVKEAQRLGMVVDVAHMTYDGVKGVVKAATKPILLSHTALFESKAQGTYHAETFRGGLPTMQARMVKPEHAKAVAGTGGVVGLWALFPSIVKYVEGLRELVDVVGIDHVAIGLDRPVEGVNYVWPDQADGLMYALAAEMLRQGFAPDECGKILGGNACRVLKACL